MLKHFSIYEREKHRKNSVNEHKQNRKSIIKPLNLNDKSSIMNQELLNNLIRLGFKFQRLIVAHKLYKFQTLDEALLFLTKDTETKLYNHKFYRALEDFGHLDQNQCSICEENANQHFDDNSNQIINKTFDRKINDHKNNDIKENNDITVNRLLTGHSSNHLYGDNILTALDRDKKLINKSSEIILPQETINELENPNLCIICFCSDTSKDPSVKFQCAHIFCLKCVKTYLEKKIENGGGCPLKIKEEIVNHIVDENHSKKYIKFYNDQKRINNTSNKMINCPYPDCEEIITIDPTYENRFFTCDNMHEFCSLCKSIGWHQENDCMRYDENLLIEINNKVGTKKYKQCPNCYVIIEKNEGCNHMTCINCQYQFCWLCMRKYSEDHYAIYNIIGCPGMEYENSTSERLRKSCFLRILWAILVFFLGVLTIILVICFFLFLGCPYEFVKCYLDRSNRDDEEDVSFYDYEKNRNQNDEEQENKQLNFKDWIMIINLVILGIFLQPLYLLFYLLMALVEFYRQCGCWIFWAYNS